jgi:hypothetical protein
MRALVSVCRSRGVVNLEIWDESYLVSLLCGPLWDSVFCFTTGARENVSRAVLLR